MNRYLRAFGHAIVLILIMVLFVALCSALGMFLIWAPAWVGLTFMGLVVFTVFYSVVLFILED